MLNILFEAQQVPFANLFVDHIHKLSLFKPTNQKVFTHKHSISYKVQIDPIVFV